MPASRPAAPLVPAIGYIRVSWAREEMISPQTQRAAIETAAPRRGCFIVDWVEDLDMTGRNFKRKIMSVIGRVKEGEAEAVLVWKYSRFGRDRYGNAVNIAELERAGGELVSATEDLDTSTATGKFQRGMLLEVAAFESDRAGETWAETYAWRVRMGLPPFGRPRFGYRRDGRAPDEDDPKRTRHVKGEEERYVPDPERGSEALAAAYLAYLGGSGFHAIAGVLNEGGWRTAYGGRWRLTSVKDVLDSGFGAGKLWLHDPGCRCKERSKCRHRRYLPGAHDPVIGTPEWEGYLRRRAEVAAIPPRARIARYAVTGLVRCGHCRSAMVPSGTGGGGSTVFSCSRSRNYGDGCKGRPSLGVNRVEAAVREAVSAWAADVDAAARDAARDFRRRDAARAVGRLEAILAEHDRELVSLARKAARAAAAEDILGDDAWRGAAAQARAERDQAAADLEAARAEAAREPAPAMIPVMTGLMESWDILPPDALNRVLRTLIRRVAVYRDGEKTRGPEGWWRLMPARFEVLPVWEPDPWEGEMPSPGKASHK